MNRPTLMHEEPKNIMLKPRAVLEEMQTIEGA